MTNSNSQLENSSQFDYEQTDENKFIVFSLGEELYGSQLLTVREVVEKIAIKPVPNTIEAFLGVCNLRGQIIGVVDLRSRFNVANIDQPERPVLFVFETESGAIAAAVDKVVSVSVIPPQQVENHPNIVSVVPSKYILGIGKLEENLITLVDLKAVLSHDELTKVASSKMIAA